ncbi:MAG: HAMP domain-containing histidine kinase [Oscillospiraceae bacterium]|nr:HAMP domain-containing histidine kinase [Oscillospiraceae bacterium]
MKAKKTKIRIRILKAFSAVLFVSFLLTAIIFNLAIRLFAVQGEVNLEAYQTAYAEASRVIGRVGIISVILISVMFLMAIVVTYFLANSLTRPIEKLGKFAQSIGQGDFSPNDFQFQEVELDNLNTALNKSVKQLGEYDSDQKAFFQNASHELRTPLMSIQCHAEGISFDLMEPKQAAETILTEIDNLADLVTDLLYISKIDNITTAYTTAETDLTQVLRDSAERQEAVAAKRDIRFSFDFGETPIQYTCVGELLARAIDNLLSNAVRYAASQITLSCHKRGDRIEIRVADDGAGIAPDALSHVFERFYKGADGNHGIGLSIVKTIVEQQGGHITAENSDTGGAVFTISLPTVRR